ncbi:hypothetical protein OG272_10865 [Streptomyces sp. NBC_00104]|uniref:hypothetical protein n=1 Tax=unclassified Streptomyces TaxID=2593676 RepID=UPI00324E4893
MRRRGNDSSWWVAGIVVGLLLAGLGAGRIGAAYHHERQERGVSACIAERGVEQCLPVRTAAITKTTKVQGTFGDGLDVYLDGASEPSFTVSLDWSERLRSELVVADWQGQVWAWQEPVHHRWEERNDTPLPLRTLTYLSVILFGGWLVLHFGSYLLIEGPSRYTELAERLVAAYSGLSLAGVGILFGFGFGRLFGLLSIACVVGAIGVNGVEHRRSWRSAWRRARRLPR